MTSTAAAPAAAKTKKGAEVRPYKVLKEVVKSGSVDEEDTHEITFVPVGVYTASGDAAAIKMAAKQHGNDTYVAVAESAWHRRSPNISTKEVITWS